MIRTSDVNMVSRSKDIQGQANGTDCGLDLYHGRSMRWSSVFMGWGELNYTPKQISQEKELLVAINGL